VFSAAHYSIQPPGGWFTGNLNGMTKDPHSRFLVRAGRLKKLGYLAPRFRFGLRLGGSGPGEETYRLPFIRSPLIILISGIFLAVFCIPYFSVGGLMSGGEDDSLFGLVFTLFSLFWLLGWSTGVALLAGIFLLVTFGTEVLTIRPGWLSIRIEVLRLGLGAEFRAEGIGNLHWQARDSSEAGQQAGNSWRGDHLAFDYGGENLAVGSNLGRDRAMQIATRIQSLGIDQSPGIAATEAQAGDAVTSLAAERQAGRYGNKHSEGEIGLQATSTRVLILANLIPLAGVLLDDWSIGEIMLLFWAESAIIGFFNLLKMWVVGRWSVLFLGPFFVGHYGGFMIGHLLFIYVMFLSGAENMDPTVGQVYAQFAGLWPALLGLFISHAVSFRLNFLGRQEYRGLEVRDQMSAPYKRILIMHVTILFGGFLTMVFSTPLLALLLLILLKIVVDTRAHIGAHRNLSSIKQ
jgi:hypothetical protein